jgi:hypothetical protein
MITIARDNMHVEYKEWAMKYFPSGEYFIYKKKKEIAHGKYDAIIADSYNTGMPKDEATENLRRDLISWVEKDINKKVTD